MVNVETKNGENGNDFFCGINAGNEYYKIIYASKIKFRKMLMLIKVGTSQTGFFWAQIYYHIKVNKRKMNFCGFSYDFTVANII
jgi:hypothetical protein